MSTPKPIQEAVSVALIHHGRVLLVLRGREPAKGKYAFPGGRVEAGETFEAAARRELLEETGLQAGVLNEIEVLHIAATDTAFPDFHLRVYTGVPAGGRLRAGDDAALAGWYRPEELGALTITSSTMSICKLLFGRPGQTKVTGLDGVK